MIHSLLDLWPAIVAFLKTKFQPPKEIPQNSFFLDNVLIILIKLNCSHFKQYQKTQYHDLQPLESVMKGYYQKLPMLKPLRDFYVPLEAFVF